uniref:Uncharacterized protein n=1 Tax=Oryza brachyantha TaxID=4533 RepID=J3L615_ORYBR
MWLEADGKPIRMVKDIRQELVKLQGATINGHLSIAPTDAELKPGRSFWAISTSIFSCFNTQQAAVHNITKDIIALSSSRSLQLLDTDPV